MKVFSRPRWLSFPPRLGQADAPLKDSSIAKEGLRVGIRSRPTIQAIGRGLAGCVIAIGVLALVGWLLDISLLKRVFPGLVAMKVNTAVALVACGVGCWLAGSEGSRERRRAMMLAGGLAGLIGLLTVMEYVTAIDLGIDELLFKDSGVREGGLLPGRMAPLTAIAFVFFGAALMCAGVRRTRVASVLALFVGFFAAMCLLSYAYQAEQLYGAGFANPLAIHTALALLLLPVSLLCSQPDEGLLAILLADSAGGMMARRLVPVIALLLVALGYLELLGEHGGHVTLEMGNTLWVITAVTITCGAIFWNAWSLDKLDRTRAHAEMALKEANATLERRIQERTELLEGRTREMSRINALLQEEIAERQRSEQAERHLATIVNASPDAIISKDLDDRITSWNPGAQSLFGYTPEEVIGQSMDLLVPITRHGESLALLRKVIEGEEVRDFRSLRRCKDGREVHVSISVYPLRNSTEEIIGAAAITRDISERVTAEETLRKQAELLELAHDAIFVRDLEDRIVYWNRAAETRYGWSRQEALKQVSHTLMQTVFPQPLEEIQKLLLHRGYWEGELLHRTRDGRQITVASRWSVQRDEAGAPVAVLEINNDITDRKTAEETVRQSEARYRSLIIAAAQVIWMTNDRGDVSADLPSWRAYTGQTMEELRSRTGWANAVHPDDRPHAIQIWSNAVAERRPYETEYRLRRHDGEYRHMLVRGVPVLDEQNCVREWVGACTDISERKQAEAQVLAERQRLTDILNIMPVSLCLLTPDFHVPFANKAFVNAFAPVRGRRCYEALFNRDTPCPWCQSFKPLKTGKPHRWPFTGPNGRIYDVHDFPFTDVDGSPLILEVELDITEEAKARELLEKRVRERTAQLEASNQELDAFAYSVSHDLRAPLRSIDGFSQAVFEDYHDRLDDQGRDYLQRVRAASQRMASLIDDLLKLSRTTRGEIKARQVDLSDLAREIVHELRDAEPNRDVEVVIAPESFGHGDPQLLGVVLQNLLSNAWKFTSKREHGRIEFGMTSHEGKPAYFVRDNGAGFDMAYQDKLFGAFQRLHPASDFPGSGIGLATVKRIIHRHGGRVWAEGAVDQGATFYFTLGS